MTAPDQDWFEAVELPVPVRDEAAIGPVPRIRQLAEAHAAPEAFLVALVDRTHLRIFRVLGHEVRELPSTVTHQERSVDTSIELGSFQHHDEEVARAHLRRAAAPCLPQPGRPRAARTRCSSRVTTRGWTSAAPPIRCRPDR